MLKILMIASLLNMAITIGASAGIVILTKRDCDNGMLFNICVTCWAIGLVIAFGVLFLLCMYGRSQVMLH